MAMSMKRRLAVGAAAATAVGAVATLITGFTFGLFSATQSSGANTFTAGTVTLSNPASTTCTTPPYMSPGDGTTAYGGGGSLTRCSFTVNYGGNVPAYLALDVSIAGTPGTGPSPAPGLYDSTVNGLQVLIKDNQGSPVTYMNGTTLGGSGTSGASPGAVDLLVSKSSFSSGATATFTIDYLLPTSANNSYQGAASTITLTVHAVQSANNGSTGSCTVGQRCDNTVPGSGPAWS